MNNKNNGHQNQTLDNSSEQTRKVPGHLSPEEQERLLPNERLIKQTLTRLTKSNKVDLRLFRDVGKHLLDTYYEGNIEFYDDRSHRSQGAHSFNLLCKHREELARLGWSASMLRYAIQMHAVYRENPKPWMDKISKSHQIALLSVGNETKRDELATKVVNATSEKPYSRNQLLEDIREWRRGTVKPEQHQPAIHEKFSLNYWVGRITNNIQHNFDTASESLSSDDIVKLGQEITAVVAGLMANHQLTVANTCASIAKHPVVKAA